MTISPKSKHKEKFWGETVHVCNYIEYLPELVIIEIDPSDEPQANIRP